MRRLSMWAASVLGAVGAGAGLALARRRRPATESPRMLAAPSPAGQAADADAVDAVTRADDDATPATPAPDVADDPREALDAARARLRERADRLRRDIDAAGGSSGGA